MGRSSAPFGTTTATTRNYNYFRDHDPAIGRYLESDPIGLDGGVNTYAYVESDPVNFADGEGLTKGGDKNISTEGFNRHSDVKDVEKALEDAVKNGQKKRAKALRALIKVIKRGGTRGSIVPPGLIEGTLAENCENGSAASCEALCTFFPERCEQPTECPIS